MEKKKEEEHTPHTTKQKTIKTKENIFIVALRFSRDSRTVVVSPSTFNLDIGAVRRWIAAAAAARRHRC
jgi:hypothetical protein